MLDNQTEAERLSELEERVETLERSLITREVLDDELRTLELRMREMREVEEG